MLIPNILYNFINKLNGKTLFGSVIEVANLSGRSMVVNWKSKQRIYRKSKKSKYYKPTSEGESVLDTLDSLRIENEKQARYREKEELKGLHTLVFGLLIFVLSSLNAFVWASQSHQGYDSDFFFQDALRVLFHAVFIGLIYVLIIGVSVSIAIKENRLDFNYVYRLCKYLFWFSIVLTIVSLYPIVKIWLP